MYINFDEVVIGKVLGVGVLGTTYLATYKGKEYALKVERIALINKVNIEVNFYKLIDKLKPIEQIFFTKLYGYRIVQNCKHNQVAHTKALAKSKTCVNYLLEYKGNTTYADFMGGKVPPSLSYSIALQLIYAVTILYNNGYFHGDLHMGNIMINKTTKKVFNLLGRNIPYNGYQVSLIDYGTVQRAGVDGKYVYLDYIYKTILSVVNESARKKGGFLPRDNKPNNTILGLISIMTKHKDYYNKARTKYLKLFPKARQLLIHVEYNITVVNRLSELVRGKPDSIYFWSVISRIENEFYARYPKLYFSYFRVPVNKCLVSEAIMLEMLSITDPDKLINYFIDNVKY